MPRQLSEEELQQRREAGRRSAERRRKQPTYEDRLELHRERQETDPLYRANTTDIILNTRLPADLGGLGGLLGLGTGLGLGYAAAPRSGEMMSLLPSRDRSLITRAGAGISRVAGSLAGHAAGNLANQVLMVGANTGRRWRELRGKPTGGFAWDAARQAGTISQGKRLGRLGARAGYSLLHAGRAAATNVLHGMTGRRRLLTGLAIGALPALALSGAGARLGHRTGESLAPFFPLEVRKMNTTRLQKALDYAVYVKKEMDFEVRGPGRPRGRPLSQEEIEQRRNAARVSAQRRRERAAAEAGVDVEQINSRGQLRERAYTPRVREGAGHFRTYTADEENILTQGRETDRREALRLAESQAYLDSDLKVRRGDGRFRASRLSPEARATARWAGEFLAPGYGRYVSRILTSTKDALSVDDPAAKFSLIGGGIGAAAGGLIGSAAGKRVLARATWRGSGRLAATALAGLARLGGKITGKPPSSGASRRLLRSITTGRKKLIRPASAVQRSFGTATFAGAKLGGVGAGLGHTIGRQFRDEDYQQRMIDRRRLDIERRAFIGGR